MKKIKQATQTDSNKILPRKTTENKFPFPAKEQKVQSLSQPEENDDCDCSKCNDTHCKAQQVMDHLADIVDLTEQIGPPQLYNIILTLGGILSNLEAHGEYLTKIEKLCQVVYSELNPKEMGRTLN